MMSTRMSLLNCSAKLSLIGCLIVFLFSKIPHLHTLSAAVYSNEIINSVLTSTASIQKNGFDIPEREQDKHRSPVPKYKNEIELDCVGKSLLLYEVIACHNNTELTNLIVKQMTAFSNSSCILATFSNSRYLSTMQNFGEEKQALSKMKEAVLQTEKEDCEDESENEEKQKMVGSLLNKLKNPAIYIRIVHLQNTSKIAATVNDKIPMQDFDPVNRTIFADFFSPIINQLIVLSQCIATTEVDQLMTINSNKMLKLYFLHYSGPCKRGYGDLQKLEQEIDINCRGKLVTVYETHKCNLNKPYREMIVERLNQISLQRRQQNQGNCALVVYTDPVIPFIRTFGNESNSRIEEIKRKIRARECKTGGSNEGSLANVWTPFLDRLRIPAIFFTFTNNGNIKISLNRKFGMDEVANGNSSIEVEHHDQIIEERMNLGKCIANAQDDHQKIPGRNCEYQRYSLGVQKYCTGKVFLIYIIDECRNTRSYTDGIIQKIIKYPEYCFLIEFRNSELPSIRNFGFNSKSTDKIQQIINSVTQSRCKNTIGVENENAEENLEFLDHLNIPAIYFASVASNEVIMIPNNKIVNGSNNQGRIIMVSVNDKIITDTIVFSNITARSMVRDLASTELIEGNLLLILPNVNIDVSPIITVNYFSIGSFTICVIMFLAIAIFICFFPKSRNNRGEETIIKLSSIDPDRMSGRADAKSEPNLNTSDDSSSRKQDLPSSFNLSALEDSSGLRRRPVGEQRTKMDKGGNTRIMHHILELEKKNRNLRNA